MDTRSDEFSNASYQWLSGPRWYLLDGGFLLKGRAQTVLPAHSYNAVQVVVA